MSYEQDSDGNKLSAGQQEYFKDSKVRDENSFVALTELVNKHGDDVIVAIHLNKHLGRTEINKIASLYSKTDDYGNNKIKQYVDKQISNGNLLDVSINKAPNWFTAKGLQLPSAVQTILDANSSIRQTEEKSQEEFSAGMLEQFRYNAV